MIKNLLDILELDNFYGVSENIEILKGKYKIPESIKEAYEQGKRLAHGN